jgi:hypothetical protein
MISESPDARRGAASRPEGTVFMDPGTSPWMTVGGGEGGAQAKKKAAPEGAAVHREETPRKGRSGKAASQIQCTVQCTMTQASTPKNQRFHTGWMKNT